MMNNIPTALRHGDFMAMHSDMVGAARGDVLSKEQVAAARSAGPLVYDFMVDEMVPFSVFASRQAERAIEPFTEADLDEAFRERNRLTQRGLYSKWLANGQA